MGVFAGELKVEKVRENNKMESTNNIYDHELVQ